MQPLTAQMLLKGFSIGFMRVLYVIDVLVV